MKAGSGENPSSGKSRLATSKVVGSTEALANRRSTVLAARCTPTSGKSEDPVEMGSGIGRGPGPAQAERETDAQWAGHRVALQMSVKFPPGGIDTGNPLTCGSLWISGLSSNGRRQHGRDRGLGSGGCRSRNFNGRGWARCPSRFRRTAGQRDSAEHDKQADQLGHTCLTPQTRRGFPSSTELERCSQSCEVALGGLKDVGRVVELGVVAAEAPHAIRELDGPSGGGGCGAYGFGGRSKHFA